MSEYEIDKIDEIDEIDELDDSWITEIEKEEEDYNSFYKEENETIKLVCIYINNKNKIYYVKKESIILENKILDKTKLIFLLKNNKIHNEKKHKLISILQYNIDLAPEDLGSYLKSQDDFNFLTVKSSLNEIKWDDTITLFKDLNSLHIIYYEDKKKSSKNTKKIYIRKLNRKSRKKLT